MKRKRNLSLHSDFSRGNLSYFCFWPGESNTYLISSRFLPNLTNRALTASDLEAPLASFRQHLIDKNVASDVADKLCASVATKLEVCQILLPIFILNYLVK